MRSHRKGSLSAATPACRTGRQVKVLSSEIFHIALGQGFHFLETNNSTFVKGENVPVVPESESVAGERTVYIGTWENRSVPRGSFQEVEETTRRYDVSVVGLTHSRGVNRVMPIEFQSENTRRGQQFNAESRGLLCHTQI